MTGHRFTTEEMLARLIAFDTTSRDGNLPLIAFVEDYLDGWGVPHIRVDYEAGRKTNLYATVGPDIAGHVRPVTFEGSVLTVQAESTAWATQIRLLTSALLGRIEAVVGAGVVTDLVVLGPAAPSWIKGKRRVQGRGPRDTYG